MKILEPIFSPWSSDIPISETSTSIEKQSKSRSRVDQHWFQRICQSTLDPVPERKDLLKLEIDASIVLKPCTKKDVTITSKGIGVAENDITPKDVVTLTIEVF